MRLGNCLTHLRRFEEAEAELLAAFALLEPRVASGDAQAVLCAGHLCSLYTAWDKPEQAAKYKAKMPATNTAPTTRRSP
jgi:hypothetical protein